MILLNGSLLTILVKRGLRIPKEPLVFIDDLETDVVKDVQFNCSYLLRISSAKIRFTKKVFVVAAYHSKNKNTFMFPYSYRNTNTNFRRMRNGDDSVIYLLNKLTGREKARVSSIVLLSSA